MPLDGYLLDVQADFERNKITSWIKTFQGPCVRVRDSFFPTFYVHGDGSDLSHLKQSLQAFGAVESANLERHKLQMGRDRTYEVLAVTVRDLRSFARLPRLVDAAGHYRAFTLYNVEMTPPQQYMVHHRLFPTARLVLHPGPEFEIRDSRFERDYAMPPFRTSFLSVTARAAGPIPGVRDPIDSLEVSSGLDGQSEVVTDRITGSEEAILQDLQAVLSRRDPDLIVTEGGDSFLVPYLYGRARACGLEATFFLGREAQELRAAKRSRSYFSYGKIVYKPGAYTLRGRVHIDGDSSLSYGASGLWGTVELARLSGLGLQTSSRQSPGTAMSSMEVLQALDEGYLVAWKKNTPEDFKTLGQLFLADRGGFTFEPRVGVHSGILELDFSSLYPRIMIGNNLSMETLMCPCCKAGTRRVPVLDYHICTRQVGLVPRVLRHLVDRRDHYKRLKKEAAAAGSHLAAIYEERSAALKWLLVTSFGYMGYRHAKFGRIECHEAINAFAREVLLDSMRLAEQSGYEVLHGIVDSLWLKPRRPSGSPERLAELIEQKTGLPISIEGVYRWLVLLPNKHSGVGALNRYYGLFQDNTMKVRGIELRKHDTPRFLREVQREMLQVLARAANGEEFLRRIPDALAIAARYKRRLRERAVAPADLVFTRRISQGVEEYRQFNHQKACLRQLAVHGIVPLPGQSVRFVVTNARSRDWTSRVCAAQLLDESTPVDARFYAREVDKMTETMFDFLRVAPHAMT